MLEEKKRTKLVSLKKKENLETALAIREKVSLNKVTFSQNTIFEHGHKQRVRKIQFSSNNKFMATISSDCVKLWRVGDHVIGHEQVKEVVMIPFEGETFEEKDDDHFHVCISDNGQTLVVMRGTFNLEVFKVDMQKVKFEVKDKINLKREIIANKQQGNFDIDMVNDTVHHMRFFEDDKYVRIEITKNKEVIAVKVCLADNVTELTKRVQRFEDVGIFAVESKDSRQTQTK